MIILYLGNPKTIYYYNIFKQAVDSTQFQVIYFVNINKHLQMLINFYFKFRFLPPTNPFLSIPSALSKYEPNSDGLIQTENRNFDLTHYPPRRIFV